MKAIIKKVIQLENIESVIITLSDGNQFQITEGHNALMIEPGVECEARRYYPSSLAWEIVPIDQT